MMPAAARRFTLLVALAAASGACFEPVVAREPVAGQPPAPSRGRPVHVRDGGAPDSAWRFSDGGTYLGDGGDGGCVPLTCRSAGAECGTLSDGCGGELTCETCWFPLTCGGDEARPNLCAPVRVCDAEGWCWDNPLPQGHEIIALRVLAEDDLWAVAGPRVLRWNGEKWSAPTLPTTARLNALWANGPDDLWVGGAEGVILRWDGERWERFPHPLWRSQAEIVALWGSGPDNLWAATRGEGLATLLHWDGRRWLDARDSDPATPSGRALWGFGEADLWLVGDTGALHHWDGASWTVVPHPLDGTGRQLRALWGSAPNGIWAVGDGAATLHWNGTAWIPVPNPVEGEDAPDLVAVWGTSRSDVWMVGSGGPDGGVLLGWGGMTMSRFPLRSTLGLSAVGNDDHNVWIGGEAGFMTQLGNPGGDLSLGFFEGRLRDVWWAGEDRGEAVGDDGLTVDRQGLAKAWWGLPDVPGQDLHAVWGAGDDLWRVGDGAEGGGFIFHSKGRPLEITVAAGLRAVWGASEDDVWIAGALPHFLHWDGTSLTEVERPASSCQTISSVWGAASDDVWAVGECGTILHWDGAAWSARSGVTHGTLLEVAGSSPDAVWAVGSHELLRFDGSGWSPEPVPEWLENLSALWVSPEGEVWLGGRNGLARRTATREWQAAAVGTGIRNVTRIRGYAGEMRVLSGVGILRRTLVP